MHVAAYCGHTQTIETLVRLGSTSLDTPDRRGWTPLHQAAYVCSFSAIEALVRLGSRAINALNNDGQTPLYCALLNFWNIDCTLACTQTLVILGANTDISTEGLTDNTIEFLHTPIDEDESAELRYGVYFADSLVYRLLLALCHSEQVQKPTTIME